MATLNTLGDPGLRMLKDRIGAEVHGVLNDWSLPGINLVVVLFDGSTKDIPVVVNCPTEVAVELLRKVVANFDAGNFEDRPD